MYMYIYMCVCVGRTGLPVLHTSGLTLTVQLGGGEVGQGASESTVLDPTDGVWLKIGGVINPGAGSVARYVVWFFL